MNVWIIPPDKPPKPADMLVKVKRNLEWIVEKGMISSFPVIRSLKRENLSLILKYFLTEI